MVLTLLLPMGPRLTTTLQVRQVVEAPVWFVSGPRKTQGDARGSKARARVEAQLQAMGQAKGERCKSAREDMGVHRSDCPSREIVAC